MDYIEFLKNDGVKFKFFFFHFDDPGNICCKAKGEIKYVIFDETINSHTIVLYDKRYGLLMVKFNEKEVDQVKINNKIDKKVQVIEPMIQEQMKLFNQYKFDKKFNNHIYLKNGRTLTQGNGTSWRKRKAYEPWIKKETWRAFQIYQLSATRNDQDIKRDNEKIDSLEKR